MQYANQREQSSGSVVVDIDLVGEPLNQQRRSLVVQRSPPYIDRLYLRQIRPADGLVIAFADNEIVADDAAKGGQRQKDRLARAAHRRSNVDAQPVLLDGQVQMKWSVESGGRRKMVFLKQIENRNCSFILDIGAAADHRVLVECDVGDPPLASGIAYRHRFTPCAAA